MRRAAVVNLIRKIIQWLLLAVTVVFLITGFGITEFRVVEAVTLGWFSNRYVSRSSDKS